MEVTFLRNEVSIQLLNNWKTALAINGNGKQLSHVYCMAWTIY